MTLEKLKYDFSVCKLANVSDACTDAEFCFIGKTDEELSLVCRTCDVPPRTVCRDDGWRAFRVQGTLDFSLIGILSGISGILAGVGIGIFAISTYNTDYILTKTENFECAAAALREGGFTVTE